MDDSDINKLWDELWVQLSVIEKILDRMMPPQSTNYRGQIDLIEKQDEEPKKDG